MCVCVGVWSDGVETTSIEAMLKGQGLGEGLGRGQYRGVDVTWWQNGECRGESRERVDGSIVMDIVVLISDVTCSVCGYVCM